MITQAPVTFQHIADAHKRIGNIISKTPIVESSLLNKWLGHRILFKAECLQKTGAFKMRGACNVLAHLHELEQLPKRIVANSSGNHAQAVAFAAAHFNIPATIYTASNVSVVKAAATEYYGAEVLKFPTRLQADAAVAEAAKEENTLWIPPYNHADIIAGQGTATYEALQELPHVDVVAAPCGGGGLLSGSLIATRELAPNAKVIGAEPLMANDAARSLRLGKIVGLEKPAVTFADGAATPMVGELTFPYLQQTDGFYEVDENRIAYWTQWLQHLLKLHIEPTCAMTMEAIKRWLIENKPSTPQTVLVIISGGNIAEAMMRAVWREDHLQTLPSLSVDPEQAAHHLAS